MRIFSQQQSLALFFFCHFSCSFLSFRSTCLLLLQFFICLDPVSGDVLANSSFLNASLTATAATTSDGTCGVWGEGFYAKVTWVDSGDADVFGLSNDPDAGGVSVPVLGGVFLKPNDSTPMSIAESQVRHRFFFFLQYVCRAHRNSFFLSSYDEQWGEG